ncbi:MAG: RluA family pseudouridine synthase [Alphaproteobacteria bacterium]|nr:RluA family pseudouridine synthase [Alphaproteobacteria bacterium]
MSAASTGVQTLTVADDEDGLRLDRWFRRHFPGLTHGRLEKLLRTGQVRVDGARVKAGHRLSPGQNVRVPPLDADTMRRKPPPAPVDKADAKALQALVLHRDRHVLVINKPPGLAVQGGSKVTRHLDGMLDALTFDAKERPRLVHRLDKDTSGVLLLGRSASATAKLAAAFRGHAARKIYWALVVGVPRPLKGRIDLALSKRPRSGGEVMKADPESGKRATTLYATVENAGQSAAWLALMPLTGRTHQLRVHCAELGMPIQGDGKYGGQDAFLEGEEISKSLHLHARSLTLPHPGGGTLSVTAPLPDHMLQSWRLFGLNPNDDGDPFAGVEG